MASILLVLKLALSTMKEVTEGMKTSNEFVVHRPGALSAFFIYKAGFFAGGFWAWLVVLVARGESASAWPLVAATGAATTSVVSVVLGARYVLQRNAAERHEQVMRTLVEMSWQSFSPPVADDSGVIRLPESRQRPRR
jgi:RNA-splicing ligase RtcB